MRMTAMLTAAFGLFVAAQAGAQSVTYDFDKSASFGAFKTYSWAKGTPVADSFNHERIVSALDAQLAAKGLVKAAEGQAADVVVAYHAMFDENVQITGFASGWGGFGFGGTRSGSARAEKILVGTLVVDVVDPKTKSIAWRGVATKEIDPKAKPEKRDKEIQRVAGKLFKNYPPQAKS